MLILFRVLVTRMRTCYNRKVTRNYYILNRNCYNAIKLYSSISGIAAKKICSFFTSLKYHPTTLQLIIALQSVDIWWGSNLIDLIAKPFMYLYHLVNIKNLLIADLGTISRHSQILKQASYSIKEPNGISRKYLGSIVQRFLQLSSFKSGWFAAIQLDHIFFVPIPFFVQ